ncbi:MAG: hypothetical protein M1834_001334 [Cirrosporium novae-zelandiae]|nr:MAG: hypothetical protein M1834_001334 [Cirrosporium novae-zelandiae]
MVNISIAVTFDTVCPWCYIGLKRLRNAIATYKNSYPATTFTITWHPYYLNPAAPKVGTPKRAMYASKFGPDRANMIFQRLEAVGKQEGINFSFGGNTGNTRTSHRLIAMTGKEKGTEMQNRVVEELFKSYFEKEGDITDVNTLTEAAKLAGLEEGQTKKWLESDAGGKEVDREVDEARERDVTGVPDFIIQNKYNVGGAQDPDVFVGLFEKARTADEGEERL